MLAAGFGVGVAVMAILLGVADVVLTQARSSDLVGGGDVVIHLEPSVPARMVLSGTLQSNQLRSRIRAAGPSHTRGAVPAPRRPRRSRRRAWRHSEPRAGDGRSRKSRSTATGSDTAGRCRVDADDARTTVLRQIDRFHDVPDAPTWQDSWAEWLYFNGRARDARFYLTFLVGPTQRDGSRPAGVRLQLDRDGQVENFSAPGTSRREADAQRAPELTIGGNHVTLGWPALRDRSRSARARAAASARGRVSIEASPGRLVPPIEIGGAHGWRTGYVVPVMSGQLDGTLDVAGERISFDERHRLSRSQLGILARRVVAVGTGAAGRSVVHLRTRLSAAARLPTRIGSPASSARSDRMVRWATRPT